MQLGTKLSCSDVQRPAVGNPTLLSLQCVMTQATEYSSLQTFCLSAALRMEDIHEI